MTGYRTPLVQVVSLLILLRIEIMAFYFLFGFVFIAIYTVSRLGPILNLRLHCNVFPTSFTVARFWPNIKIFYVKNGVTILKRILRYV